MPSHRWDMIGWKLYREKVRGRSGELVVNELTLHCHTKQRDYSPIASVMYSAVLEIRQGNQDFMNI